MVRAAEEGAPPISKPLYIACALFFGAYLSYFMVPLVGHGTAKHAVELAKKSTDPMLQKSAADRIALLSGTGTCRELVPRLESWSPRMGWDVECESERREWVAADSTAEVMVKVGAVAALLGLLATSSDANVLGSTVCALAVLSKCGAFPHQTVLTDPMRASCFTTDASVSS